MPLLHYLCRHMHYLCRHVHYSVPPRLAAHYSSFGDAPTLTFGSLTPAGSISPIYPP